MFKHQDLQISYLKVSQVCRGSETQLRVGVKKCKLFDLARWS